MTTKLKREALTLILDYYCVFYFSFIILPRVRLDTCTVFQKCYVTYAKASKGRTRNASSTGSPILSKSSTYKTSPLAVVAIPIDIIMDITLNKRKYLFPSNCQLFVEA